MIASISIELFKNLAQYYYDNQYYDFHNDYSCKKIFYSNGLLTFQFKSLIEDIWVALTFLEVNVVMLNFFNINRIKDLTLDNLYRGRTEINGELVETAGNGKCYFYLEFYEGQKMEFWAKYLCAKKE